MNTKKWLTLGLSVALAGCLGWAVAACAPTEPNPNEGDKPGINNPNNPNTPDNPNNPDNPGDTPDADLDTREFWATGSGAGDLSSSSWTELKSDFKLKKEPHKDAEGFTLYTIQFKIYAGGDKFKIRQDERDENNALVWTDGTYFGLSEIRDNNGTFIDMGNQDVGVAKGKDGIYKFTVHTKPAPAPWKDNYVSWELVESVAAPTTTEDMYIVGTIASRPQSQWPDYTNVKNNCIHMTFDGTDTWYAEVELARNDQFKVYNILNGQYFPSTSNLGCPSGGDWLYRVSWKVGEDKVNFEHVHKYTTWTYDAEEHWKKCPKDDTIDQTTRAAHDFSKGDTCECGFQQASDADWKINDDGSLQEYTGDYVNMKIPANLTKFPKLGELFGLNPSNTGSKNDVDVANYNKVKSITIDPANTSFKIVNNAIVSYDGTILYLYFPYNTQTSVTFEDVTEVYNASFIYNTKIQSLNFPKVTKIDSNVFKGATALKSISAPKAEYLGGNCFDNTAITAVEFESLTKISGYGFVSCPQLTSIVLGDKFAEASLVAICDNCPQLKTVTVKATTPPKVDSTVFSRCPALEHIYVPEGSVDAYKAAKGWTKTADKISAMPAASSAPVEVALLPDRKD